jgi:hypothetical protein
MDQQELLDNATTDPRTVADLIGERLELSVDQVMAVLEMANTAAYSMEMNLQQLFDSYTDMDLYELGMFEDVVDALDSDD